MRYKATDNSTISYLSPGSPGYMTGSPPVVPEVTVQDLLKENLIFSLNPGKSFLLRPPIQSRDTPPPGARPPGGPPHLRPAPSPPVREAELVTLRLRDSPFQEAVVPRHLTLALHCQKLKNRATSF